MFLSDDDMVECPYNKTHLMLRKRLQSHLLKCRQNYPDVELRKCPFNITHLIPEPEFTHHATNCPDRKLITQYKYDAPEQKEEEGPKHAPIECDENWDDTDVNDYNPRLHLDKANIIRQPDGANRSERKLFIKKERKRLGDGDDSCDTNASGISSPGNKHQSVENYDFDETRTENLGNRSNDRDMWSRNNRSTSPPTSSFFRERSRSPKIKSKRNRSPAGFKKSYKDVSPPGARNYSPPSNLNFSSAQDPYYVRVGRYANNNQYNSGREQPYSSNNSNPGGAYNNRNHEMNVVMPEAPPPPMISYPAPRSYFAAKPPSSTRN